MHNSIVPQRWLARVINNYGIHLPGKNTGKYTSNQITETHAPSAFQSRADDVSGGRHNLP